MSTQFFQGIGVVDETIRGRVHVIQDWKQNHSIDSGEVLIVRFPIPKISAMLKDASALLCAYGSSDSYLAKAAQDWGIPAVFKLGQSLDHVTDGTWVSVDSATGKVSCEMKTE